MSIPSITFIFSAVNPAEKPQTITLLAVNSDKLQEALQRAAELLGEDPVKWVPGKLEAGRLNARRRV